MILNCPGQSSGYVLLGYGEVGSWLASESPAPPRALLWQLLLELHTYAIIRTTTMLEVQHP